MSSHPLVDPAAVVAPGASEGSYRAAIARAVHGVARALEEGSIAPGDAADLRRLKPESLASPAFWRVVALHVAPHFERLSEDDEARWAVILNALAVLPGLDDPRRPLGAALRDAGFSELRFTRLLRAEHDRLADNVRSTARFLASKGEAANLAQLAELVLSAGRGHSEPVRRRIARDFFQPTKND